MKGWHAYVLIVVVIVAVLVNVHAHRSTRRLVREVQGSVRSLRDEVRELRAMVGVIGLRLEAFSAPSARAIKQPAVGEASGSYVAQGPPMDDVGEVQTEPVDVLRTGRWTNSPFKGFGGGLGVREGVVYLAINQGIYRSREGD